MTMDTQHVPVDIGDPVNATILSVSEDQIQGFQRNPIGEIVRLSGVDMATVIDRIRAMLEAGTIRRTRQTLLSTSLAPGALVAWKVSQEKLQEAFDAMFQEDPFSGHVVIRSTDAETKGSAYRLWTTLKVPQGYSLDKHARYLMAKVGADHYRLMPAKRIFALGVGHVRRKTMDPGSKTDTPATVRDTVIVELSDLEWQVLTALKREFEPEEIVEDIWAARAEEAGLSLDSFYEVAEGLDARRVIGRFSTFLEHAKELKSGERVTRYNALFHWAVPAGQEMEAGREIGRHHILTHCYWREGGPEFGNVNIMAVAHGMEREKVYAHKQAIDDHLASVNIPLLYTNVFWGGRVEIKPSEISPLAYAEWAKRVGLRPEDMKER
jgi:DNA-binding Lrp family transcriptional regulator